MELTEMNFTELKSLKDLVNDLIKRENYKNNENKTLLNKSIDLMRLIESEIANRILK